jgi:membrane-associated protease RseP (regulator of RpoE activity)
MNIDLILALLFYILIISFILKNKSKFQFQGKLVAIRRTKLGLKLMEKIANKDSKKKVIFFGWAILFAGIFFLVNGLISNNQLFQTLSYFLVLVGLVIAIPLNITGIISVVTGFAGMGFIFYWLTKGTIDLLLSPTAIPAVAPVLPGIKVMPGLPILSFMHWIIAILIIAVIHEFSHGIFARFYKIKVKSSGWALFGPILAAFVEPDEKQLSKKSKMQQLSVFSAGPFSNIITGIIFILIMGSVTLPLYNSVHDDDGVIINNLVEGYAMESTGIEVPFTINSINGLEVKNYDQFSNATKKIKPGEEINMGTSKGEYNLIAGKNPDNQSKAFIGVSQLEIKKIANQEIVNNYGSLVPPLIAWIHMLFFWLWVVSWGVGLFNLLPLGPVDGGRMILTGLTTITKNEKKSKKYWTLISMFCLLLIFLNLAPYLWKLITFLFKPLLMVFALI